MALGLDAVLAELLGRLRALRGEAVDVSAADLRGWAADAVAALQSASVLVPGAPAASVVCTGCEEACVRPVEVLPRPGGTASAFVLCHLREDTDSVPVSLGDLARWRFTAPSLADALAGLLDGQASAAYGTTGGYRLGFVQGRKNGRALLRLQTDEAGPRLMLAGHAMDVQDTLVLKDGRLAFDLRMLARCVDAPADAASDGPAESQEIVGKRMLARKLALKAAGTKPFLQVIAREENCSKSWVKQLIAKASAPNPFAGLGAQPAPDTTVSTGKKRPR